MKTQKLRNNRKNGGKSRKLYRSRGGFGTMMSWLMGDKTQPESTTPPPLDTDPPPPAGRRPLSEDAQMEEARGKALAEERADDRKIYKESREGDIEILLANTENLDNDIKTNIEGLVKILLKVNERGDLDNTYFRTDIKLASEIFTEDESKMYFSDKLSDRDAINRLKSAGSWLRRWSFKRMEELRIDWLEIGKNTQFNSFTKPRTSSMGKWFKDDHVFPLLYSLNLYEGKVMKKIDGVGSKEHESFQNIPNPFYPKIVSSKKEINKHLNNNEIIQILQVLSKDIFKWWKKQFYLIQTGQSIVSNYHSKKLTYLTDNYEIYPDIRDKHMGYTHLYMDVHSPASVLAYDRAVNDESAPFDDEKKKLISLNNFGFKKLINYSIRSPIDLNDFWRTDDQVRVGDPRGSPCHKDHNDTRGAHPPSFTAFYKKDSLERWLYNTEAVKNRINHAKNTHDNCNDFNSVEVPQQYIANISRLINDIFIVGLIRATLWHPKHGAPNKISANNWNNYKKHGVEIITEILTNIPIADPPTMPKSLSQQQVGGDGVDIMRKFFPQATMNVATKKKKQMEKKLKTVVDIGDVEDVDQKAEERKEKVITGPRVGAAVEEGGAEQKMYEVPPDHVNGNILALLNSNICTDTTVFNATRGAFDQFGHSRLQKGDQRYMVVDGSPFKNLITQKMGTGIPCWGYDDNPTQWNNYIQTKKTKREELRSGIRDNYWEEVEKNIGTPLAKSGGKKRKTRKNKATKKKRRTRKR